MVVRFGWLQQLIKEIYRILEERITNSVEVINSSFILHTWLNNFIEWFIGDHSIFIHNYYSSLSKAHIFKFNFKF